MLSLWIFVIFTLSTMVVSDDGNRLSTFTSPEEIMNACMLGISHKTSPGPESELFDKCKPWKKRSCCTESIAKDIHVNKTWYKMDWDHCGKLSDKCRARFVQDLCFYECSPNVGPWLVKVDNMKIRKERFVNVPLCRNECDAWWEDCVDDLTCIENWARHFDWSSGIPQCPSNTQCRTFREVFKNSTNFCEKVWDHSWQVVEDTDPDGCFAMWWMEGAENPNYEIAYRKAQRLISSADSIVLCSSWNCFYLLFVCICSVFSYVWYL
ncbi:folic acid receptor [Mactra antiquata]